jgi:hypothetical protein
MRTCQKFHLWQYLYVMAYTNEFPLGVTLVGRHCAGCVCSYDSEEATLFLLNPLQVVCVCTSTHPY